MADEYINKVELIEQYPELDGYTFADVSTIDIVTCKDCMHWERNEYSYYGYCTRFRHIHTQPDYFCADGERRKDG